MGMSQRRKGKVGEREFRDVLISIARAATPKGGAV